MRLKVGHCLIPEHLDRLGWTQRRLAQATGIDEKHLSKITTQEIKVATLPIAVIIADALGVSPRALYEWISVK